MVTEVVFDSSADVSLSGRHYPPLATSENPPQPPTLESLFEAEVWLEHRGRALEPLDVSDLVTTEQTRRELIEGARLLGMTVLHPHQLVVADMLNAGHEISAILATRQIGKTKTLLTLILGRCATRPRYNAAFSITTLASKSSEVFTQSVIDELETLFPDPDARPFRLYRGKGSEHVRFPNGSRFSQKTAKGASFRASSYDLVWLDEAGEADPEQAKDLLDAILSTFDTTEGQLVLTGTAGTFRKGQLLYEGLANPENGRVRYAIPEDTTPDELAEWEPTEAHPYGRVRELTLAMHPGIACGLTTEEKARRRFYALGPERYAREYLGIFGRVGEGGGPINITAWLEAGRTDTPDVPERFALAGGVAFKGQSASLVAAWRDEKGRACGYVLDHRKGSTWLADAAAVLVRKHSTPMIFDTASSTMRSEVEVMRRMTPRPRVIEQAFADVTAAAAGLVKEINTGNSVHWSQPSMDAAAKGTVRRSAGASAWAFGRGKSEDLDLSPIECWALALRYFDEHPHRTMAKPIVSS
jgi:hypothetical protein